MTSTTSSTSISSQSFPSAQTVDSTNTVTVQSSQNSSVPRPPSLMAPGLHPPVDTHEVTWYGAYPGPLAHPSSPLSQENQESTNPTQEPPPIIGDPGISLNGTFLPAQEEIQPPQEPAPTEQVFNQFWENQLRQERLKRRIQPGEAEDQVRRVMLERQLMIRRLSQLFATIPEEGN